MKKITFLGTGDLVPTAQRNHTAILLTYYGENILVDCGEGTQRQFRKAKLNPCKITRILITHWHGDHVLGLPGLLKTLALSGYNKTLYIYGPRGFKKHMEDLFNTFGKIEDYKIEIKEVLGKFFEDGDFYLESKSVEHGVPCNAYCFVEKDKLRVDKDKLKKYGISSGPHLSKLREGKSFTYDGKKYSSKDLTYTENGQKISFVLDAEYNSKISTFVKNSQILICESNFGEDEKELAKKRKHLTSGQAAKIARESKSDKLIITHVGQRYSSDSKIILNEAKKIFKNSVLVNDFDVVMLK